MAGTKWEMSKRSNFPYLTLFRTQDYFTGEILMNGKKILDLNGNYMGYMDVGGMRYFDIRLLDKIYFPVYNSPYFILNRSLQSVTQSFLQTLQGESTHKP